MSCEGLDPGEKRACEIEAKVLADVKTEGWHKFYNVDKDRVKLGLKYSYVNQVLAELALNTEGMECDVANNFECRIRLQENLLIKPGANQGEDQTVKLILLNANKVLGGENQAKKFGFRVAPYDQDRIKEGKPADFEQEVAVEELPNVLEPLLEQLGTKAKQHLRNTRTELKAIQSLAQAATMLPGFRSPKTESELEM